MEKKKSKIFYYLLIVGIIALAYFSPKPIDAVGVLAFPVRSLAGVLTSLASRGTLANVIAVFVYVFVCLSPIYLLNYKSRKRGFILADLLLILLSACLFAGIYFGIKSDKLPGEIFGKDLYFTIINVIALSILLAYLVLDYINSLEKTQGRDFNKPLKYVLYLINAVLIISIALVTIPSYYKAYKDIDQSSSEVLDEQDFEIVDDEGQELDPELRDEIQDEISKSEVKNLPELDPFSDVSKPLSKTSLGINFIHDILPSVIAIVVTCALIKLLDGKVDVNRVTALSSLGLKCLVLFSVIRNVFTYFVMDKIHYASFEFNIPLAIIIYLVFVLTLATYIKRNRELEEDNQLFI